MSVAFAMERPKIVIVGTAAELEKSWLIPLINTRNKSHLLKTAELLETAELRLGTPTGPLSTEKLDRLTCLTYTAAAALGRDGGQARRGLGRWMYSHRGNFFNPEVRAARETIKGLEQCPWQSIAELVRDKPPTKLDHKRYVAVGDTLKPGTHDALALLVYTLGAARFPECPVFQHRLGKLFDSESSLFAKDATLAVSYAQRAFNLKPDQPELILTLADRQYATWKLKEAARLYNTVDRYELSCAQLLRKIVLSYAG